MINKSILSLIKFFCIFVVIGSLSMVIAGNLGTTPYPALINIFAYIYNIIFVFIFAAICYISYRYRQKLKEIITGLKRHFLTYEKTTIRKIMTGFLGFITVTAISVIIILSIGSDLDARYVQVDIPYEARTNLGNAEIIFVNIAVTQNARGWGRQRISYSLQSGDETVAEGQVERFLAYRLWNNRRIDLFRYDFSRHSTYLLEINLNDVHVYSQILFGR